METLSLQAGGLLLVAASELGFIKTEDAETAVRSKTWAAGLEYLNLLMVRFKRSECNGLGITFHYRNQKNQLNQ